MHDHEAFPELPPGPRTNPVVALYRWMSNTRGFLEEAHREFGDVFTVRMYGARPQVCFGSVEAVRDILRAPASVLGHNNDVTQATLGKDAVLLLNGDVHATTRRRLMPAFTGESLFGLGPTMKAVAEGAIDDVPIGARVPMLPWARRVTLDIMQQSLFGMTDGPAYRAMAEDVIRLAEEGQRPLSFMLAQVASPELLERVIRGRFRPDGTREPDPLWAAPLLKNALVEANRRLQDRLVAHARGVRSGHVAIPETSILARLLRLAEQQGVELSDLELATDLITLLVAGHDTTAVSFSWVVQALARHPEALETLRRELADAGGLDALGAETLGRLPYLDAVIRESMRLTPIAPAIPRTTLAPVTIAGVALPAGVSVLPMTFAVHHDEAVHRDAQRFDPNRMREARARPETWFPFGGGYRRCVGAYFATLELKFLLAAFVERVVFDVVDGAGPLVHAGETGIVTAPADEAPLAVRRIRPRRSAEPFAGAQGSSAAAR